MEMPNNLKADDAISAIETLAANPDLMLQIDIIRDGKGRLFEVRVKRVGEILHALS